MSSLRLAEAFFMAIAIGKVAADPILQIRQDWADPSFLHDGNTYYSYATGSGGKKVQIASATNFDGPWTILPNDGLPNNPPAPWVTPDSSDGRGSHVWAPEVVKAPDGTFVLYFSASIANPQGGISGKPYHCVGAATSTSPKGPFNPQSSPLACQIAGGGAIDPAGFQDPNGAFYVTYKVDGNNIGDGSGSCGNSKVNPKSTPIMLQRLANDRVTPIGDPVKILDRSDADGPLVEAPSLIFKDGLYYLFFSSNCYNSGFYDTSYATATSVDQQPYVKVQAPYAPLLKKGSYGLTDPGGATVRPAEGLMMFHADSPGGPGARYMYTAHISQADGHVKIL